MTTIKEELAATATSIVESRKAAEMLAAMKELL